MTRRRRQSFTRSPIERALMWDSKVEPETYTVYLTRVKDIAFRRVLTYQVVHEELIRIVKDTLSKYPQETSKQHAYMWYIQGLWYIKQRYSDKALQIEADALYMYFRLLGLEGSILRELAQRLGITISSDSQILQRANITVVSVDAIYYGTKRALQETLHGIDVNLTDVTYEYDPTTGNVIKITGRDKITGKIKIIHFEWDANGNLIRKWEEWA